MSIAAFVVAQSFVPIAEAKPGGIRPWTLASVAPDGSQYAELSNDIARTFERTVPGLRVRRRLNGVLGDEAHTLELVAKGRVQLWTGSLGALVKHLPAWRLLEAPYLFPDEKRLEVALRHLQRGRVAEMSGAARRSGFGHVILGAVGWRNIASLGKPIRSPADLKGIQVRSQPGDVHRAMWQALGARPVETSLNSLAFDLRTLELGALDVPVTFLFATSAHRLVRHVSLTRHIPQFIALAVSKSAWASLSKRHQTQIHEGVGKAAQGIESRAPRAEGELFGLLRQAGVAIVELSPDELQRFQQATGEVRTRLKLSGAERRLMARLKKAARARP